MGIRLFWVMFVVLVAGMSFQCQAPVGQESAQEEPASQEVTTDTTGDASTDTSQPDDPGEPPVGDAPGADEPTPTENTQETTPEKGPDSSPDGSPAGAWKLNVLPAKQAGFASNYLLGQYELSGEMFKMDTQPGLSSQMKLAGFSEWRLSVGRWEVATWLMPTLTDGSSCATTLAPLPSEAKAPATADFDLMKLRDWFTYTDGSAVTRAMTNDDSRYKLDYLRKQLDIAAAFGAVPFVSVDHMPRALAATKTPLRTTGNLYQDPCLKSFTNAISNGRPADPAVYGAAVVGLVKRIVEGSDGKPARKVIHWEIGNEPEFAEFWDR